MPGLDGFAATREIRMLENSRIIQGKLPIIALTADVSEENETRCRTAGMDSFLGKPVRLQGILTRALLMTCTDYCVRGPGCFGSVFALIMSMGSQCRVHTPYSRVMFCFRTDSSHILFISCFVLSTSFMFWYIIILALSL